MTKRNLWVAVLSALGAAFLFTAVLSSPATEAQAPSNQEVLCSERMAKYAGCLRSESRTLWQSGDLSKDAFLAAMKAIADYSQCLMQVCATTEADPIGACELPVGIPKAAMDACPAPSHSLITVFKYCDVDCDGLADPGGSRPVVQ